jgi:hypothetical protein
MIRRFPRTYPPPERTRTRAVAGFPERQRTLFASLAGMQRLSVNKRANLQTTSPR